MRNNPRPQAKARRSKTKRQGTSWKYSVLTLMCGAILVTGFFFAGKLHFSSMDYGIRNSKLRKQLDELESEKRRLLLSREISLSPAELLRSARKFGFTQTGETSEVVKSVQSPVTKARRAEINVPIIQKTVISRPIEPARSASIEKTVTVGKRAGKEPENQTKKAKS